MPSPQTTTPARSTAAVAPSHRRALLLGTATAIAVTAGLALGGDALLAFHVSREPDPALAARAAEIGRMVLWGGFGVIVATLLAGAAALDRLAIRWVFRPARALAIAAESVAAGDLTSTVQEQGIGDVRRLAVATRAMLVELRRLAGALATSSGDTSRLAEEISAAAEELAAGAGEMAATAGELSEQSTTMASSIQAITGATDRLAQVSADLDRGSHIVAQRNRELRELSLENRARLDESSQVLTALSTDAAAGVASVESLVEASEEIRGFVTLVRKLARQSKLLALNAAMEAARAGDEGEGFAVVASEVRRLAAMSADAAERTEAVVQSVLSRVEATRAWSVRTEATVREVSAVTTTGAQSFAQIETAVTELDVWAVTMAQSAGTANQLTQEITAQLGSLSLGIETFASAMEQVAASSEEQSAATEEVAAAAGHLTAAAARLADVVAHLRVQGASEGSGGASGAAAAVRRPATPPVLAPSLASTA